MDTAYAALDIPFREGLFVLATVMAASAEHAVADAGLKALATDHGNPGIDGAAVWYLPDEHIVFAPSEPVRVSDRVRIRPSHIDPTIAKHERMYLARGDEVEDVWEIDLPGW